MDVVKDPHSDRDKRLTRMVKCYQSDLLTLCYAYVHERQLAEDAVQETFLRAYRALDTFRGDCAEKTWLTSIAINVCRNMRRGAWFARINRSVTPEDMSLTAPEEFDQEAADLAAAIQRLPDTLKEVILLRYYEEMSVAEIAGIVGVSSSMVSRRIKQAHTRLHGLLGEEDFDG